MIILMVITSYLLIGAIIGWKDSKLVEDGVGNALKELDDSQVILRKAAVAFAITLIILAAPIVELIYHIGKLKSKLGR